MTARTALVDSGGHPPVDPLMLDGPAQTWRECVQDELSEFDAVRAAVGR